MALDPRPGPPPRRRSIGNFWVDLVRGVTRIFLPLAVRGRHRLDEPGRRSRTSTGSHDGHHGRAAPRSRSPADRSPARRPSRSWARTAAASSTPTRCTRSRTPTAITNFLQICHDPAHPVRPHLRLRTHGRGPEAGLGACSPRCSRSGLASAALAMRHGDERQPRARRRSAPTRSSPPTQPGGNMEGKETRFGPAACGLFAATTTGTSTGAVNCAHDSLHAARRHGARWST